MASSALNVLSGIAAAAAGLAGEKVSKTGSIPGFDLAKILPALVGKSGGAAGVVGTLASAASKSGVLNASNLAKLAGTLISITKTGTAKNTATDGIMGLAGAILGNSGSGVDLGSIAKLATKLGKTAEDDKGLKGIASDLGSTLKNSFGVSFNGPGTALTALTKVMGGDSKTDLIKAVLKGIS